MTTNTTNGTRRAGRQPQPVDSTRLEGLLLAIADGRLAIDGFGPRRSGSDRGFSSADYQEVSRAAVRTALLQAYLQGYSDACEDGGVRLGALTALWDRELGPGRRVAAGHRAGS